MSTPVSLFDYHLPPGQIAQEPMRPRDHSRLLVLDRTTGERAHKTFFEIADELRAGDVLVMNDTKVFKARVRGRVEGSLGRRVEGIEIFLLRGEGIRWSALVKPGRKVKEGDVIDMGGMRATVQEKREDGIVMLDLDRPFEEVLSFTDAHGEIPVPPYVASAPAKLEDYQTVYARETGSVAAPTAGFHFTPELIASLKEKGVQFEFVTLHVGIGTFRPVKTDTLEEHAMHAEFVRVDAGTASRIRAAKREGRRVIAVGTTTVRALEGSGVPEEGFAGEVNMFITPGYEFRVIDALITNFHLPKSTLLVLVSALAGRENILAAYEEAVRLGYRFFSFGDAMLVH